ncbi:family 43 glycosylhydrolase [Sphingobium yanoikuyae]|uniref:family 43 glycosylhydrolase n=1 Tax=Sphingobium yanoikuyae TaxID=13690 RepID=UPI0028A58AD6|nr:family 43 glycosylhydrolase [Sphingobium yanoikuyae]
MIRFGNRFLMYYTLPSNKMSSLGDGKAHKGLAIGIAESRDIKNWHKIGEILPDNQVENNGIAAPSAIVINGKIHLFYQSYGNGASDAINHASSSDGVHFERDPGNPVFAPDPKKVKWSIGRAIDAEAFVVGDRLMLYYATRDPTYKVQKIGVASASINSNFSKGDFKNINDEKSILEPELSWERSCIEAPSIISRNGKLYMFYAGGYNNDPQQIGVAVSDDGIKWKRTSTKPFLANGSKGSWNYSESGHPDIFQYGDRTFLFFQGNADHGKTWTVAATEIGWNKNGPYLK